VTSEVPAPQSAHITKTVLVAADGREYDPLRGPAECPPGPEQGKCLDAAGYRNFVEFQPFDFWRFQWTEAGILLAGTLLLGAVAVRGGLRRRA
jgi:hypothetical protein